MAEIEFMKIMVIPIIQTRRIGKGKVELKVLLELPLI